MYHQRIQVLWMTCTISTLGNYCISQKVVNVSGGHGEADTTADIEGVP